MYTCTYTYMHACTYNMNMHSLYTPCSSAPSLPIGASAPSAATLYALSLRRLRSSHPQLLALRRFRSFPRYTSAAIPKPPAILYTSTKYSPHLHQAKESGQSFRTLILIGVAAACAVLTPFSTPGLCAAGRTLCRLLSRRQRHS